MYSGVSGSMVNAQRVTPKIKENLHAEKVKGILERQWSREKSHRVETVQEFTYLGDNVSVSAGCEAAVTLRTKCGWAKCRECGE